MMTYEIDRDFEGYTGLVFRDGKLIAEISGNAYDEVEDEIIIKYFRGY